MKSHDLVYEIQQTAGIFGRNKEVSVVFEGDRAYTDGSEIVLPSLPQGMEYSKETTGVFRGYLDHEAGHIRHTDIESVKKYADHNSDQAFAIWNCLEDMWLEKKVMEEYNGSEKNLRALASSVGELELKSVQEHLDISSKDFTADSVTNAILRCGRKTPHNYGGEANDKMYDLLSPKLQEWGNKWVEEVHKCKNSTEIFNLALEIERLLESTTKTSSKDQEQEEEGEGKGEGLNGNPSEFKFDPNGDPCEGKPSNGKGQQRVEGKGELKDSKGRVMGKRTNEYVQDLIQHNSDIDLESPTGNSGKTKYRVLTTRFDEVYEANKSAKRKNKIHDAMTNANVGDYQKIKDDLGGLVNTMKAKLRRALMAKETRDWDFAREFGRLDTKKLVAGSLGSATVYKQRKERMEMDTAVHLLIDLSGSMFGDKIRVATEVAIAFAECLEGTQIKYQISGFSNYGDNEKLRELVYKANRGSKEYHRVEPLNIFKYKKFGESLQVAKGAVSAIRNSAGGNNSDRDAVIWAAQELKARPEKRKILFVFSDGQPANTTINLGYDKDDILEKALKEAIDSTTKDGVECVGIGILTEHVEGIYPRSVSIESVKDLSGATFVQLSNLLTGGKVRL